MKTERFSRSRSRSRSKENPKTRNFRNRSPNPSSNKRVYVTNIPFTCRWSDLKDLFREKVGDVAFVDLFEDEITGRFKGSGVVEFHRPEFVAKAIETLDKYEYKGRPLIVKEDLGYRSDRKNPERFPAQKAPPSGSPPFNTYGLSLRFLDSLNITGPLVKRVFVTNLSYRVDQMKLADIFNLAGKVVDIDLKKTPTGTSKGHAVVEFEHPVEAVQAISMFNNQSLYDRPMIIKMDRFVDESLTNLPSGLSGIGKGLGNSGRALQFAKDHSGNITPMGDGGPSRDINPGVPSNLRGLNGGMSIPGLFMNNMSSSNTLPNINIDKPLGGYSQGPPSPRMGSPLRGGFDSFDRQPRGLSLSSRSTDTILLRNLPSSVTWQTIKDKFRDVGDIRHVEIVDRGTASMRFGSERDAQRAVDLMHGLRMDGRPIVVTLHN